MLASTPHKTGGSLGALVSSLASPPWGEGRKAQGSHKAQFHMVRRHPDTWEWPQSEVSKAGGGGMSR